MGERSRELEAAMLFASCCPTVRGQNITSVPRSRCLRAMLLANTSRRFIESWRSLLSRCQGIFLNFHRVSRSATSNSRVFRRLGVTYRLFQPAQCFFFLLFIYSVKRENSSSVKLAGPATGSAGKVFLYLLPPPLPFRRQVELGVFCVSRVCVLPG